MNFVRGRRYLGGFIDSAATKGEWLRDMVATWTAVVETLAVIAEKHPQTAYAGFAFSLQNEWQYLQQVVADAGLYFSPLEVAIRSKFIPALLGIKSWEVDGGYRELLTHGVKQGGLPHKYVTGYWRFMYVLQYDRIVSQFLRIVSSEKNNVTVETVGSLRNHFHII